MNARLTWSLTFQGFLFTTSALSIRGTSQDFEAISLVLLFSAMGVVTSTLTYAAVRAAAEQHRDLMERWNRYFYWSTDYFLDPRRTEQERSGPPQPFGSADGHSAGQALAMRIPLLLFAAWCSYAAISIAGLIAQ